MSKSLEARLEEILAPAILHLDDYKVFQSFYCYNQDTRRIAKTLVDTTVNDFFEQAPPWPRYSNFLVWAPPGYGKTHLANELNKEIQRLLLESGKTIVFRNDIDLKDPKLKRVTNLWSKLEEIRSILDNGQMVYAFADEVHAWGKSFVPLHEAAGWSHDGKPVVWLFAGSHGKDISEMIAKIKKLVSGRDFVDRIPLAFRFSMPILLPEDKLIIAAAHAMSRGVGTIHKAALAAIALRPEIDSSRNTTDVIEAPILKSKGKKIKIDYTEVFSSSFDAIDFQEKTPLIASLVRANHFIDLKA